MVTTRASSKQSESRVTFSVTFLLWSSPTTTISTATDWYVFLEHQLMLPIDYLTTMIKASGGTTTTFQKMKSKLRDCLMMITMMVQNLMKQNLDILG